MSGPWEDFESEEPKKAKGLEMGSAHPADQYIKVEQPGTLDKVFTFIDEATGTPVRKGLREILQTGDVSGGISTALKPGLVPTEEAPTGKEIAAEDLGLSTEETLPLPISSPDDPEFGFGITGAEGKPIEPVMVSPAGVAGLGVDVLADRTPVIGPALKGGANILKWMFKGSQAALETTRLGKITGATQRAARKAAKAHAEQLYKAGQSMEYEKFLRIAEKNGIDTSILPEAIEFGKESGIARQAAKVRAGQAGQPALENYNKVVQQTSEAMSRKIDDISGGRTLDPEEAGVFIRDTLEDTVRDKIAALDETYNNILFGKVDPVTGQPVIAAEKGLLLSDPAKADLLGKLKGKERQASNIVSGRLGSSSPRVSANEQLLDRIKVLKESTDDLPRMLEIWRDIGQEAFGKQVLGVVSPDQKVLRDLYFDVSSAMQRTIRDFVSPEYADALKENNRIISDMLTDKNLVIKAIKDPKKGGQEIFNALVTKGTPQVQALKNILTPEQFRVVRGAYLKSLVKKNIAGEAPVRGMFNRMRDRQRLTDIYFSNQYGPGMAGDEVAKRQLGEFSELMQFSDNLGAKYLSSSETGAVIDFNKPLKESVKDITLLEASKELARQRGPAPAVKSSKLLSPSERLLSEITQDIKSLKPSILPKGKVRSIVKGGQLTGAQKESEKRRKALRGQ